MGYDMLTPLGFLSALLLSATESSTVYLPLPAAPTAHVALHCAKGAGTETQAVLFVHGASFPTMLASGFEFAPGDSWMDYTAQAGYLACGLDFLGYGGSSRPAAMAEAADKSQPLIRAPEATSEIALAVEYLRTQRHMARIHLVAHSWGTIPAAKYAADHPGMLASLTLFGPVVPTGPSDDSPVHYGWFLLSAEDRYQELRFTDVLPPGTDLLEAAVHKRWAKEFAASGPHYAEDPPDNLRIPAGFLPDIAEAEQGRYPYDPRKVVTPLFVVYGDYDTIAVDAGVTSFINGFSASPVIWRLKIRQGTHVMHLERNRRSLYESVLAFIRLNDAAPETPAQGR